MPGRSVLLIGGARSGKSALGQRLASSLGAPVTVVVTAEALDAEMGRRIDRHRRDRPEGWATVEAPRDLAPALLGVADDHTLILDCVTLWVSNQVLAGVADADIEAQARVAGDHLADRAGTSIVIGNEVGQGIVPGDPLSRAFRDAHGRVNQIMAAALGETYLVVAGRLVPTLDPATLFHPTIGVAAKENPV